MIHSEIISKAMHLGFRCHKEFVLTSVYNSKLIFLTIHKNPNKSQLNGDLFRFGENLSYHETLWYCSFKIEVVFFIEVSLCNLIYMEFVRCTGHIIDILGFISRFHIILSYWNCVFPPHYLYEIGETPLIFIKRYRHQV